MASVSFQYEVPFGHRLMFHEGKCRFPHGHNYMFKASVHGAIGRDGMVMDFSTLKKIVREFFEPFDHAFVLHESDPFADTLRLDTGVPTKVVLLSAHPTAENLALLLGIRLLEEYSSVSVECWEQRDCVAYVRGAAGSMEGLVRIVDKW